MKIKDIMSKDCRFISHDATLQEAAQKMQELDCGFIPVNKGDKLCGVITDRDIALRGVAENMPADTPISSIMSEQVLYCFESDSVNDIAKNMSDNLVRRLVVLNNAQDKKLCGVVSVCDIVTAKQTGNDTASRLIQGVSQPQKESRRQSGNKSAAA